jgi:hypothetical protein
MLDGGYLNALKKLCNKRYLLTGPFHRSGNVQQRRFLTYYEEKAGR